MKQANDKALTSLTAIESIDKFAPMVKAIREHFDISDAYSITTNAIDMIDIQGQTLEMPTEANIVEEPLLDYSLTITKLDNGYNAQWYDRLSNDIIADDNGTDLIALLNQMETLIHINNVAIDFDVD